MSEENPDMQKLEKVLQELGEHFDSVQLFCTRHEPEIEDGTVTCCKGVGNWFTRYGQVRDWITKTEERTRIEARKDSE